VTFNFDTLKDILVCPQSRSALVLDDGRLVSVDPQCRLSYAVADKIPIMLVDEATQLTEEEWAAVMQRQHRDTQTGEETEPAV